MRNASYLKDRLERNASFCAPSRAACALLLATIVCAGTLTACTTGDAPSTPADPIDVQPHLSSPEPSDVRDMKKHPDAKPPKLSPSQKEPGAVPDEIMRKLVAAVAQEASVGPEDVKLDRAEKTTFSDGSLDCPQPNMAYSQALVEGYWVVFHVGREEYDMRVTDRGHFSRCQGSTKRAPIRYDDT